MLKIDNEKLAACGLNRGNDAEFLHELRGLLEWLENHNKNYTKMQYNKILDALDFVKSFEIVEV